MNCSLEFKKTMVTLTATAATLGLIACSSGPTKTENDLDRKVTAQAQADSPEQIRDRAAEMFTNSPGLTVEQKAKLTVIYQRTYGEAMTIRKEIGQNKSMLFELIATKNFKSKEVNTLKKRLVDLDHKRLEVMFQALEDVQNVVGTGKGSEEIYKHLRDYEIPRPGRMLTEY